MILGNPIYLWGLLGLAVPLAIHLWSRKEGRTIRMGSIKLLRESDPKQTSNIRISEWWLLLLRMLVITLVVLIMAAPQVQKQVDHTPVTYLIEPSLLEYEEVNAVLDTLPKERLRLLQPGFPGIQRDQFPSSGYQPSFYWQLAREMKHLPTDSIVVFTNGFVSGVRGRRPAVAGNIRWVVIDPGSPENKTLKAVAKEDEVELISVFSDHRHLSFERETLSLKSDRIRTGENSGSLTLEGGQEVPLETGDSLDVLIFYDDFLAEEMSYIQSSYRALETFLDRRIRVQAVQSRDSISEKEFHSLVWLSQEPIMQVETPMLIYRPDSLAGSLIEPGPSTNRFHLTRSLDTENIVKEHLPERLLDLLNLHQDLEGRISSHDKRVMALTELVPRKVRGELEKGRMEASDLSAWLWLFLITLLLLERGLARYKRQ